MYQKKIYTFDILDHFQSNSFAGCELAAQNAHPLTCSNRARCLGPGHGGRYTSQLCSVYQKEQPQGLLPPGSCSSSIPHTQQDSTYSWCRCRHFQTPDTCMHLLTCSSLCNSSGWLTAVSGSERWRTLQLTQLWFFPPRAVG